MLDTIKTYSTLIIGTLVVAVVLGLGGFSWYEAHRVTSLTQAAGTDAQKIKDLNSANANLQNQIKTIQQSSQVNQVVTQEDVQGKADNTATQATVTTTTQQQVDVVQKKYQPQGPTQVISDTDAEAEATEISTIQVNSMWTTYCNNAPSGSAGCTAASTQATPTAAAS